MSTRNSFRRLMAMVLTAAMLLTLLPAGVLAAEGVTIPGEETTTEVGVNEVTGRNNTFNKGWKFYLGTSGTAYNKNFDDSAWESVDLPHDFSISQDFTSSGEAESGFLPGGTGWYRKTFTLDEALAGQTVLLNFDGVYSDATVYVNGEYVGEHHYGYTSFAFDITDLLVCDGATENVIAVEAVNNIPTSRWYSGSGIYRDVTLIVTDPVHVDLNGTKVTTPTIADGQGDVDIAVEIVNDGDAAAEVTLTNTLYEKGVDAPLAVGDTTLTVDAGAKATAKAGARVEEPKLWSIDEPNLYVVKTELSVDGQVVDTYETEFGFRWFSFDSQGFHLNGENVKLNGVCMHHDQGALGSAAYYDAIYRQMTIMKDMGANAIRVTHNPAAAALIQVCNELGLLVIEETFDGLVDPKNGNYNDFSKWFEVTLGEDNGLYNGQADMMYSEYVTRSQIKRDRNAPAIIAWSFGNEIQEGTGWGNVSRYASICANYITWVQDVDGTRPVTSGDNNRGGNANLVNVINTITASGGIAGFNYSNSASSLYSLAQTFGGENGVIIASETASATNSRGQYGAQNSNASIDGKYHLTSYDTSAVGWGITAHDSIYNTYQYDCVAGEFVWTGFDYIGEPTPWNGTGSGDSGRGAIPNSSYFGIVETTGFAKDTYYLYRSQWNKDETTLNLVTAWDDGNMMTSGGKTPVWIYSNAPVVKLYRNGEHIGTATRTAVTSDAGHTYYTYSTESLNADVCTASANTGADALYSIFNVVYEAGTISAKAFEADGTTEIALDENSGKHTVSTPDAVSKLVITQDKTEITADGESLVYITVDVTDESSNLDTRATNNITFTLEGEGVIMGVDNGDQATTKKYQQASALTSETTANIDAYAGKALVIVKSTDKGGEITVDIASNGLTGGTVTVNSVSDSAEEENGLVSYTMIRDYSVMAGTAPAMGTAVTGTLADGTTVSGTVAWNEITADVYGTAGDHNVLGTATFEGVDPIMVSARLHVIPNVIAMRNISAATTAGTAPSLPAAVAGVLADGTVTGEFKVEWDEVDLTALAEVGDVLVVGGTATVLGDATLPVTCSVRVAQAVQGESINVAPMALTLEQDIPSGMQSDRFESIINDVLKPGDNTSERWTNWNYRTTSDNATITLTWATAQMVSSVNLFYYYDNCCAYPEAIEFSYSLNGEEYQTVEATEAQVETYNLGAQYSYTFAEPINPVGLKIKLTQQSGTSGSNCVGLTELQVMSYAAEMEVYGDADLSGITVDGAAVENFDAETLLYQFAGMADEVTASTDVNAGITVLPVYEDMVRILTISEDGTETKTYILSSDEDAILATSKTAALKELAAYADAISEIDYTAAALAEISAAAAAGEEAIRAAESVEAVADALAAAKAAIDAVGKITVLDDLSGNDLDTDMPATAAFTQGENEGSRAIQGYYSVNDTDKVLNASMTAGKPFTVSSRVYVPADALSTTTGSFEGSDKHNMIAALGDNTFALRVTTNKSGSVHVQTFVHGDKWYQLSYAVNASFADKWHDIAATYEGTTLTLYVDGVQVDQKTNVTDSITDEGILFSVGCDPTKPQRLSELTVDELVVFNECLTAEELAADHLPGDENVIFWSDYDEITAVQISETSAQIDLGETLELTAALQPAGISRALTWTSSDETVATVENGTVTAVAAGEATITVAAEGVSAQCVVTVIDPVAVAKEAALEELNAYRAAKNDIAYTAENLEALNAAADEGKAAIEAADSVEAVAEALEAAKAAMDAVEAITVLDDQSQSNLDTDLPETAQFVEGEAEGSRAVKGYYSVADDAHVLNEAMTAGKPFTVSVKFFADAEALDPNSGSFEWGDKFNMLAALGDNTFAMRVTTGQGSGRNIIQAFVSDGANWYTVNSDALAQDFVDNWHDVTVTYEGTTLTIILDGVVIGQKTDVTASVSDSNVLFSVGWDPATNRKGGLTFDSVVVYNEALTLEELDAEHKASDENVILWMNYEEPEIPENEDLMAALQEAVAAAQAAAEAAKAAQAAAEEAAATTAADQTAAEAAREAAEAAKDMADAAAKAADEAKQAAEDYADGAGESAVEAAAAAAEAAKDAANAASALATAAQAAQKAQAAQDAAEKAQADAEAAADAAEKAAASAAEDKSSAEAAASAAKAAQSAAEAAEKAADKAKDAAAEAADAAAQSNKTAAAMASAAAGSAQAAASSASSAAAAAKDAAEAAANAQASQENAENAANDTTIEKEEAEKALAEALKAKEDAAAAAAATGLALEKYAAVLDLEAMLEERLDGATEEQIEALAAAAEAAAEAIDDAESVEAVAEALAAAEAELDAVLTLECPASNFVDVDLNEWYHDAIDFVLSEGMMNGNGDDTFTPDESLNRAMLVQILYNIEGRPAYETDKSFTDVAEGDWWYDGVMWAAENGIVLGHDDGTYGPEDAVTREQMVTILYRYAGSPEVSDAEITFDDAADVDEWAVAAVAWAVENGVVKGIGNNLFNPDGDSTRAETAQVMFNYFTK